MSPANGPLNGDGADDELLSPRRLNRVGDRARMRKRLHTPLRSS